MRFAPIVPIKYLNALASLSDFHMILSQWLGEPAYLRFYTHRWEVGDTLILDNGAHELKESVPFDELLHTYTALGGADYVVIPDTMLYNNMSLIHSFEKYIPKFKEVYENVQFIAVPHNFEDIMEISQLPYVDVIGLNRDFEMEGRSKIIANLIAGGIKKDFHILGVYRNPMKEAQSVLPFADRIIGIDSSMPYRIAKTGRRLEEYRPYPEVINFHEGGLSKVILEHVKFEVERFIELVESLVCNKCSKLINEKDGDYIHFAKGGYKFYCQKCENEYWDSVNEEEVRGLRG